MQENRGIVESVKNSIVQSIRGTGEVLNAVIDTVSGTLVNTIRGLALDARTTSTTPCSSSSEKPTGISRYTGQRIRPPALEDISPVSQALVNSGQLR